LRLVLEPEAQDDLNATFEWYENQHTGLGCVFLAEVARVLIAIEKAPARNRLVRRQIRRALIRRFPYQGVTGKHLRLPDPLRAEERDSTVLELKALGQESARQDFAVQADLGAEPVEGGEADVEVRHWGCTIIGANRCIDAVHLLGNESLSYSEKRRQK
jgi:hypothetical protein